jgi:hypothetical protein
VIDESINVLDQSQLPINVDYVLVLDDVDLAPKHGGNRGSRSAIKKLIEKGGFVANESDQELLGTCSVCLEELSSPEGNMIIIIGYYLILSSVVIESNKESKSSSPRLILILYKSESNIEIS